MKKLLLLAVTILSALLNYAQDKNYLSHSFTPAVTICVNSDFNPESISNFNESLLKLGWAGEKTKDNKDMIRIFRPANGDYYLPVVNSPLVSQDLNKADQLLLKKNKKLHKNRVSKKVERRIDKKYLVNYRTDISNQLKYKRLGHTYFMALLDIKDDGSYSQDAMLKAIDSNTSQNEKKTVDAQTEFRNNSKMSLKEFYLSQNFVIVITPVKESYYQTKFMGNVTNHDASLIIVDIYQIPISNLDFQKITTQTQKDSPGKIDLNYFFNYEFQIIHRDHFVCLNENISDQSYNSFQFNLNEMYTKIKKYIPNFQLSRTVQDDAPIVAELGVSNGVTPNLTFEVIEPRENGKFNHLGFVTSVKAIKDSPNYKFKKSSFFNCEKYQILKLEARNSHVQFGISLPSNIILNAKNIETPENFQYYNIFTEIVGFKYGRAHRLSFTYNPKFQIGYNDKNDKLICNSMGLGYTKFFTHRIGSVGISLGPRFFWEATQIENIVRDGKELFTTDMDSLGNTQVLFDQSEDQTSYSANSLYLGVETMLSYNLSQSFSLFASSFYNYPLRYLTKVPLTRDGINYKENINFKTPIGINFGLKWFPQRNYKRYS